MHFKGKYKEITILLEYNMDVNGWLRLLLIDKSDYP